MAITTYSELQTAVANWLDRGGDAAFTARVPEFIALGESRLNRLLRLRVMQADTPLTGTIGLRTLALPTDFVEPIRLQLTTFGDFVRLAAQDASTMRYRMTNGTPQAWAVNGANIDVDCPCDQAHTFTFHYRKSFALSDTATTNWLLSNHPDVYLFAALVESGLFTEDASYLTGVHQRLDLAIEEILHKEARSESLAILEVDPALGVRAKSFNIYSGTS